MAKRSKKTKKNAGPAGLNSARALAAVWDLPPRENRVLVLTRNCDPINIAEDINETLAEGWTLNGQMFQTEAGSVLVFDREKK